MRFIQTAADQPRGVNHVLYLIIALCLYPFVTKPDRQVPLVPGGFFTAYLQPLRPV